MVAGEACRLLVECYQRIESVGSRDAAVSVSVEVDERRQS